MVNKPLKSEVELCHYTGSVRGAKGSWAALSTCEGIEGVLYDGATMHHIARHRALDLQLRSPGQLALHTTTYTSTRMFVIEAMTQMASPKIGHGQRHRGAWPARLQREKMQGPGNTGSQEQPAI